MEVGKILKRIGLSEDQEYKSDLKTLKLLMQNYLLHIPYENLDFKNNIEFSANILKIYEKVVEQKRGGICYELNTLFAYLLKTFGFETKMIFAKVEDLSYIGYDYPHLALIVKLDNKEYLVDVGNGQSIREPLNIEDQNYISSAENYKYKIVRTDDIYKLYANHDDEGWTLRYHFDTKAVDVNSFASVFEGKDYKQFAHEAPLLVTLALEDGRLTLHDDNMIKKVGSDKRVWNISEENRAEVLRDHFNICLDFTYKL